MVLLCQVCHGDLAGNLAYLPQWNLFIIDAWCPFCHREIHVSYDPHNENMSPADFQTRACSAEPGVEFVVVEHGHEIDQVWDIPEDDWTA